MAGFDVIVAGLDVAKTKARIAEQLNKITGLEITIDNVKLPSDLSKRISNAIDNNGKTGKDIGNILNKNIFESIGGTNTASVSNIAAKQAQSFSNAFYEEINKTKNINPNDFIDYNNLNYAQISKLKTQIKKIKADVTSSGKIDSGNEDWLNNWNGLYKAEKTLESLNPEAKDYEATIGRVRTEIGLINDYFKSNSLNKTISENLDNNSITATKSIVAVQKKSSELTKSIASTLNKYNSDSYQKAISLNPNAFKGIQNAKEQLAQFNSEFDNNPNKAKEYLSTLKIIQDGFKTFSNQIEATKISLESDSRGEGLQRIYGQLLSENGDPEKIEKVQTALKELREGSLSVASAETINSLPTNSIDKYMSKLEQAGMATTTFTQQIKNLFSGYFGAMQINRVVDGALNAFKMMVSQVRDIDTAMTELKKVTDETNATYSAFLNEAANRAQALGASISDVVNSTADYARLGYGLKEATKIADASLVYKNVGDGLSSVSEASESIISTMQAFHIQADDVMSIVDKFNEVGNKYAISSGGIGEALQRSSASLESAGNSLDQSIALVTATNSTIQDPKKVGTALKTASMYLRATKTDAELAGESVDGMASSVSKLREDILQLTGNKVDIQENSDTYKSTYEVYKELSKVWGQLSDLNKANLLEKLGGKRNANVLAALLNNFSIAENVLKTSQNSAGSALKENDKVLESIQGKINKLKASGQELSQDLVSTNIVKGFLDIANAITKAVDAISKISPLITTGLAGFVGVLGYTTIKNRKQSGLSKVIENLAGSMLDNGLTFTPDQAIKFAQYPEAIQNMFKNSLEKQAKNSMVGMLSSGGYDIQSDKALDIVESIFSNNKGENPIKEPTESLKNFLSELDDVEASDVQNKLSNIYDKFNEIDKSISGSTKSVKSWGQSFKDATKGVLTSFVSKIKSPEGIIGMVTTAALIAYQAYQKYWQDINKKASEATANYANQTTTLNSMKDIISNYAAEWSALSNGVDSESKNVSLTSDQYERYKTLTSRIAESFPDMVTGYNEEGTAILKCKNNLQLLNDEYETLANKQRTEILQSAEDVIKNYRHQNKQAAGRGMSAAFGGAYSNNSTIYQLEDFRDLLKDDKSIEKNITHFDIQSGWLKRIAPDVTLSGSVKETIIKNREAILNDVEATIEKLNSSTSDIQNIVNTYIDEQLNNGTYANLPDATKELIKKTTSDYSFKDVADNFTSVEDMENYLDGILSSFSKIKDINLESTATGAQKLKEQFDAGGISVSEYLSKLQDYREIYNKYFKDNNNFGNTEKSLISQFFGITDENDRDIDKTIRERMDSVREKIEKNVYNSQNFNKTSKEVTSWLNSLTGAELKNAYDFSTTKISETWDFDKWKRRVQGATNVSSSLNFNISDEIKVIDSIDSALSELNSTTGLSSDSIKLLTQRYESLEGFNPSRVFKRTSDGIKANTDELYKFESAYRKQQKTIKDSALKELKEQYDELTDAIKNSKDSSEIAEYYRERQDIVDEINQVADLASQYDALTSAFKRYQEAKKTENQDYYYNIGVGAMADAKELYNKGFIGTDDFRTSVAFMTNKDVSDLDPQALQKIYESKYNQATRYFIEDNPLQGVMNFLNDLRDKSKEIADVNANGEWKFNFGVEGEDAANALGVSKDLVYAMSNLMQAMGMDVNLGSRYEDFTDQIETGKKAIENLVEMGKAGELDFNLDSINTDDLTSQIQKAKEIYDAFRDDKGNIDLTVNGAQDAYDLLSALISQKQKIEEPAVMSIDTSTLEGEEKSAVESMQQYVNAINDLQFYNITGDTQGIEKAKEKIKEIAGQLDGIKDKQVKVKLGLVDDNGKPTSLGSQISKIAKGGEVSVDSTDLQNTLKLISQINTDNLNNKTVIVDADDSAWQTKKRMIEAFNFKNKVVHVLADLGINIGKSSGSENTANSSHKSGGVQKNGSPNIPYRQRALVGELGRELVVRGDKYFSVGDNGAEFVDLQKGDIVFNAEQTKQLLNNGKISSGITRGLSFKDGNAYNRVHDIYGGGFTPNVKKTSSSKKASSSSSGSRSNSSSNSKSNSNSNFSDDLTAIDWIEVKIKRIETDIKSLDKVVDSTYSTTKTRIKAINDEMKSTTAEINIQKSAYNRYIKQANSVALSNGIKKLVRNGTIDIQKYNSDTQKLISDYKEWYEKALDCKDAIDDLNNSLKELYSTRFDIVQKDFENQLNVLESMHSFTNDWFDRRETLGYMDSTQRYTLLNVQYQEALKKQKEEGAELRKVFDEAVSSGKIKKGTEAWYEMSKAIAENSKNVRELRNNIAKTTNEAYKLMFDKADVIIDAFDNYKNELKFIEKSFGKNYYNDDGTTNNTFKAVQALEIAQLDALQVKLSEAKVVYNEAEKAFNADTENKEKYEMMIKTRKSVQDITDALIDQKDAIADLQKDALKKLIDSYKEATDKAKDLHNYQKTLGEQTKSVASLQKQLAAYEGDDSEETRTTVQKLKTQLKDAQDKLTETEYSRAIDEQNDLLEDLSSRYEKLWSGSVAEVSQMINELSNTINRNSDEIRGTIEKQINDLGYNSSTGKPPKLFEEFLNSKGVRQLVDGSYFPTNLEPILSNYSGSSKSILTLLENGIRIVGGSGEVATAMFDIFNQIKSGKSAKQSAIDMALAGTKEPTYQDIKNRKEKEINRLLRISARLTSMDEIDKILAEKYLNKTTINTAKEARAIGMAVKMMSDEDFAKLLGVTHYATGGLNTKRGLAYLDGTSSNPELILNPKDTENFIDLKNKLSTIASASSGMKYLLGASTNNISNNINVNIPIEHVEDYNDFANQLRNDPQFEKLIQTMTLGVFTGQNNLNKNKYKW